MSPPDGEKMFACAGDPVSLVWNYELDTGDVLESRQWLYDGNSSELVASESHGQLLKSPSFSNRVEVSSALIK